MISVLKIPLYCPNTALGNGIIKDIKDFIYIRPETFNASGNQEISKRLEVINERFLAEKKNYVLVGPGRWGSADPWLGIRCAGQQSRLHA